MYNLAMSGPENYIQIYERFTPSQRNQELKSLYELLPDFQMYEMDEGELEVDSRGGVKIHDYENFLERIESLVDLEDKRKNSRLREILTDRLNSLLTFVDSTESLKHYIKSSFNNDFIFSIDRKSIPDHTSKWANYIRLYRWETEPEGLFNKDLVQEMEQEWYKSAVEEQFAKKEIEEFIDESIEDDSEFMGLINRVSKEYKDIKDEMTPEELEASLKNEQKAKEAYFALQKERELEISLVQRWRLEYIAKYNNEP